jgi:predicted DNA binding CopG/RHH family protein
MRKGDSMKTEYDFSTSRSNPYAKKLRRQITIRLDNEVVDYFKKQASLTGMPYQNLINLYLADCVQNEKTLKVSWN